MTTGRRKTKRQKKNRWKRRGVIVTVVTLLFSLGGIAWVLRRDFTSWRELRWLYHSPSSSSLFLLPEDENALVRVKDSNNTSIQLQEAHGFRNASSTLETSLWPQSILIDEAIEKDMMRSSKQTPSILNEDDNSKSKINDEQYQEPISNISLTVLTESVTELSETDHLEINSRNHFDSHIPTSSDVPSNARIRNIIPLDVIELPSTLDIDNMSLADMEDWPMVRVQDLQSSSLCRGSSLTNNHTSNHNNNGNTTTLSSSSSSVATLVTAYFRLRSKHPSGEYDQWMANLLSLNDPMVIFTTEDLVAQIRSLRPPDLLRNRTVIIPMDLKDTKVVQDYTWDVWKRQGPIFPQFSFWQSAEMMVVWHEKPNFVRRAIEMNPFQSCYVSWIDMGYFRRGQYLNTTLTQVLPADLVHDYYDDQEGERTRQQPQRILVAEITEPNLITNDMVTHTIAAGYMGGFLPAWEDYHRIYYETLHQWIQEERDLKSEQLLMMNLTKRYPNMFRMVHTKRGIVAKSGWKTDKWFYMAAVMSSKVSSNVLLELPIGS